MTKELPKLPTFGAAVPPANLDTWRLKVDGLVACPMTLDYAQLLALPAVEDTSPFECLEGWRVPDNHWRGVAVGTLLDLVRPLPQARCVTFHAGGFVVALILEEARRPGVLLAYDLNGAPLSPQHGWPLRLVAPGKECYYGVKWVDRIELAQEAVETGKSVALGRLQRLQATSAQSASGR